MAFASGKVFSVTYSSTARSADRCDISFKSEQVDVTNMTSSGYQALIAGVFSASATFEGPYDTIALSQGQQVSMIFAVGGGGSSFTVMMQVGEIRISTAVRNQATRFAVTADSTGTYSVTF